MYMYILRRSAANAIFFFFYFFVGMIYRQSIMYIHAEGKGKFVVCDNRRICRQETSPNASSRLSQGEKGVDYVVKDSWACPM